MIFSFNTSVNLGCWPLNLLSQNLRIPSNPGASQFGIFISCIVTSSLIISTLSWMLTFSSSHPISFNHSASSLYGTGLSHNLFQNSFASSALGGTCADFFPTLLLIQCYLVASEKVVYSILFATDAITSQLLKFCRNFLFHLLNNDFKTFCLNSVFLP